MEADDGAHPGAVLRGPLRAPFPDRLGGPWTFRRIRDPSQPVEVSLWGIRAPGVTRFLAFSETGLMVRPAPSAWREGYPRDPASVKGHCTTSLFQAWKDRRQVRK